MTLSSKGQLVIPAAMRDAMGIKAGDRLDAKLDPDGKTLTIRRVLTLEEIAEIDNVSVRTVKRQWRAARAWLVAELGQR